MGDRYIVRIAVWPHSTGRGQVVDQIQAGGREHYFEVSAESIRDAMDRADLICLGIKANPFVHMTPILEVCRAEHDERLSGMDQYERHVAALHQAAKFVWPTAPVPGPDAGEARG